MGQANYLFRDSEFHLLFQPSYCPKRVWLLANRSQWADDDSAFQDLLFRRVKAVEKRHLNQLGPYREPDYPAGDFEAGAKATLELINCRIRLIYQPVFVSPDGLLGIPNFLIFNPDTQRYIIREVKLAANVKDHPEILLQMGLYQMAAAPALGYAPQTELVTGDGEMLPLEAADEQGAGNQQDH
ncbi:MAG: hypothetical protein GX952_03975 [Firmicutes bacterium]|nr:hypothetical protein [Bacillota bacterium]